MQRARLSDGSSVRYAQVVLALGSAVARPAALQHTVPGVMELRTWADADWLQELAARGEPVLFVGGGLLGLEAADAVLSTGCPVTLVQRGPRLMPRQIDARAGALLTDRLSAKGIEILLGEEIEAINAESAGVSLAFATQPEKERTFAAVVLATGCAPRTELARAADIPCKRGITVNAAMATPLKGVFALGECAEVSGTNYQLVEPIYQQAEVLAKNLCGASAQLPSVVQGSYLKAIILCILPVSYRLRSVRMTWSLRTAVSAFIGVFACKATYCAALCCLATLSVRGKFKITSILRYSSQAQSLWLAKRHRQLNLGKDMKKQCVVIGNGMVGHHLVEQLMYSDDFNLIVIGAEAEPAYDRVHLSEMFSGKSAQDLLLADPQRYKEANVELVLGDAVTQVNRQAQTVLTEQGREFRYDSLILATGSYPFVPPVEGNDLPGCLVYRTLNDLEAIKQAAEGKTRGVVVGGGLLGLECANALKNLGLETSVVGLPPG